MSRSKKLPWMVRQGDVLIVALAALPANLTAKPRTKRGVVLAEGEVTGHAHAISSKKVVHYDAPNARAAVTQLLKDVGVDFAIHPGASVTFLGVDEAAEVKHEEHSAIAIPAGPKAVIIQREWSDADEPRQVQD